MGRTVLLSLVLVSVAGSATVAGAQCPENCPQRRTISSSGTAQVTADTDLAVVHVGYKLFAPDARTAYAHAVETSNAIMQALTASGIPKEAIESSSQVLQHTQPYELQSYPGGNYDRAQREFTATQSWMIRVKPDTASSTLNAAITAGANESGWIQWIVNDPNVLEARAAAEAIANAHDIAGQIAQKSGVRLGQLVSASQNQIPQGFAAAGTIGGIFGAGSGGMNDLLRPGQQLAINSRRVTYTVTVYAVYAIE